MNTLIVILVGAVVGALTGASLFFVPEEPHKVETALATTLRCMLVSLLTAFSLSRIGTWWQGLAFGVLYGLWTIMVVFLAEGAFKKGKNAAFLLVGGVVTGGVIGLLDFFLAFHGV